MKHFNAWLGRNLIPKTPVALLEKNTFSDEGVGSENSIEQPPKPTTKLMVGTRILDEGQVIPMQEEPVVQLTRGELYCEIWELSVAGLSRKLAIPYLELMKQIKKLDIPTPPSGYWTQKRSGKPTSKVPLSGSEDTMISLFMVEPSGRTKTKNDRITEFVGIDGPVMDVSSDCSGDGDLDNTTVVGLSSQDPLEPEIHSSFGKTYNIYDREILYKEVWEAPIVEVAKKYQVSDVAIHKVCKALDIPTPGRGFWAKARAGKPVKISPLPKSDSETKKYGLRTGLDAEKEYGEAGISFLPNEESEVVVAIASQILLPDCGARMHPLISAHRKTIYEWKKQRPTEDMRGRRKSPSPVLAESVSDETLPRVLVMIDALINAMEPLGCSLTENLNFIVNGESVVLTFSESTDRVDHVLTREESMQVLRYEDAKKHGSWAPKPQIRKYDYIFTGKLKVVIDNKKHFRDCQSYLLEDRVGDIMIELYAASGRLRRAREAREEEQRKRYEEQLKREERQKLVDNEVSKTIILNNLAEDYDIACKIRQYIVAIESSGVKDEETTEWVKWAKGKADWYDPKVAKEDALLGKREHEKNADEKKFGLRSFWR